tara:strand:+ start:135 stop:494 length:360 start_codon:yes stop_codon:yes gene_type:complete
MQAEYFLISNIAVNGSIIFRMVGFNQVYFINEENETAVLFTEDGQLIKQWNNIYEFRDDFSRDCFESDDKMMQAEFKLILAKKNISKASKKHFVMPTDKDMKYWTSALAVRASEPRFSN